MNGPALTALAELAVEGVRDHFVRIVADRVITEEEIAEHIERIALAAEAADLADVTQAAALALIRRGPESQRATRLLAQITDPGWSYESLLPTAMAAD